MSILGTHNDPYVITADLKDSPVNKGTIRPSIPIAYITSFIRNKASATPYANESSTQNI